MINDLSATDALLLLEDLSSNEANASSIDYDTDEAENYFLEDDGCKLKNHVKHRNFFAIRP